jgi:hypothetical protein
MNRIEEAPIIEPTRTLRLTIWGEEEEVLLYDPGKKHILYAYPSGPETTNHCRALLSISNLIVYGSFACFLNTM